jgi:uncharacterized protein affecting Mg2+/Co2+ transport
MPQASRIPSSPPERESRAPRAGNKAVTVCCKRVKYLPQLSDPLDAANPFWVWGYENEFTNNLNEPVWVVFRHWKIKPADHAEQQTNGTGIAGVAKFRLPPRLTTSYVSGVPMPTRDGGRMSGIFTVVGSDGNTVAKPKVKIDLPPASDNAISRAASGRNETPDRNDTPALNILLTKYTKECARDAAAVLDAKDIPASLQWTFQRLCLGQGGTVDFNSRKVGRLNKLDIRNAVGGILDIKDSLLEYSDIALYNETDDLEALRLRISYYSKRHTTELMNVHIAETFETFPGARKMGLPFKEAVEEYLRVKYGARIGKDLTRADIFRDGDNKLYEAIDNYKRQFGRIPFDIPSVQDIAQERLQRAALMGKDASRLDRKAALKLAKRLTEGAEKRVQPRKRAAQNGRGQPLGQLRS